MPRDTQSKSDRLAIERQLARMRVGEQVRAAREAAGLTVRELAERCDIGRNHISRVEAGRYSFTVYILAIFGRELGIEIKI